jgi:hypothetical protein
MPPVPATPPSPTTSPTEKTDIAKLIGSIEKERNSKIIVYWMSPQARISEAAIVPLYDQLASIGETDLIDLVLFTNGGDTEAPWRIVTLIREFCKRFAVLIPHRAHSAGTLLALGADEIVMTRLGVLGPIDPSRTHPLLPRREGAPEAEPISVQDMRHAMQFIREAAGPGMENWYSPDALAHIVSALFDKIHPLAIGAIEQSYALSKLIGMRCLSTHMDADKEAAQIKAIVDKLCDEYKSHGYQIARKEAEQIGLKVVRASASLDSALTALMTFYISRPAVPLAIPPTGQFISHISWLDSASRFFRAEALLEAKAGQVNVQGDQWVAY